MAALAAEQHAVVHLEQFRELGLTAAAVRKRAATGRLHRVHRCVYSLVPPRLLTRDGRYMAAVLACGQDAVLSHRSAAALHELRPAGGASVDVTVPRRSARGHPGVKVHRSTALADADSTKVRNIPCTTVARTLLDLAETIDRRRLERAFDQAEILDSFDLRSLHDQLARNPHRRGVPVIRGILDEHYVGGTVTWSELEERFLALVRAAAIPEPAVNAWVDPDDGSPAIRVDFVWRAQRLVVETDGHAVHRTRQARERDSRRDQRLATAGWRPIRVTWRQITREADAVTKTILALLEL